MKRMLAILSVVLVSVLGSTSVRADLNYEYYEGTWNVLPDFDSLTPVKTGIETGFILDQREMDEYIGFRFTGYIEISTPGDYTFYTQSDDGSALYIGHSLVVNNNGTHGMEERSGTINLSAGNHAIIVMYFNKTSGYGLEVQYAGPGIAKTIIPAQVLSLASQTASFPLPAHEARGVRPAAVLKWQAPQLVTGPGDPKYYVYFGTDPNFTSGSAGPRQTATSYDPYGAAGMEEGTTYYWRIDVYDPNNGGPVVRTGNRWSFTTGVGLVAFYKFDGDPNDSSHNAHHGVFRYGAAVVEDPDRGRVLRLDGLNDLMELVNPQTAADLGIDGNNPKSVTAWVYTRSFNNGGLFDVGAHNNGQEFSLRTLDAENRWRIQYHGGDYDIDFGWDSLNRWTHFALVHDGTLTRMYINGILIKETRRLLNTSGSDPFRVGQYGNTSFDGFIDDFTLWDYALAPEEVRRLMPLGDIDMDGAVDVADLKALTDDWLRDNTTPALDPALLDDLELAAYQSPLFSIIYWFVYLRDNPAIQGGASLLTGESNVAVGNQALRINWDYPVLPDNDQWLVVGHRLLEPGGTVCCRHVDLAEYDELRFWIRCDGGNDRNFVWYVQLANDPPNVTEDETVRIGPFSTTEDPNEWREVIIDLRNDDNVDWQGSYTGIDEVHYVHAILFSIVNITTQAGAGHIDIDHIQLVDNTPGCTGRPVADLNGDCILDLDDYAILGANFLKESGP
ncbi:MAG: hypothetical protein JW810_00985 [Sedimentisphaerales bacterium]|nr:hypothetical protein [Sedimentisphaerales bacterium]